MEKFSEEEKQNIVFSTFAERRIKGAILDSLRNLDFLPRNVRTRLKALDAAVNELAGKLGRKPTVQEIIDNTEYSEEDIYRLMGLQENEKMLSLDETVGDGDDTSLGLTPEDEVMKTNLIERMAEEIDKLSEKERQVVTLYYYEELTMKEVAEVLNITESRVSQIHTSATQKLKRRLKDIYE